MMVLGLARRKWARTRAAMAMLNRRRLLLHMIGVAGRPVGHLELTKWCFLLAHETPSRGGASFYQFLPYHFGPFSFCLYRDAGALVQEGYLADEGKAWRVREDVARLTERLSRRLREDAAGLVRRFLDRPTKALVDYVYERFPWFTVNSTMRRLRSRPVAAPAVYTVGYEGWSVDGFLDLLMRVGVQQIVDVRSNPVARRYGFHKGTLSRLSEKVGVQYQHVPQLGVPAEWRQNLRSVADYRSLFAHYEADTLTRETAALGRLAATMADRPAVLMCMEADPAQCHRTRLAEAIARGTGLPVRHLGAPM